MYIYLLQKLSNNFGVLFNPEYLEFDLEQKPRNKLIKGIQTDISSNIIIPRKISQLLLQSIEMTRLWLVQYSSLYTDHKFATSMTLKFVVLLDSWII